MWKKVKAFFSTKELVTKVFITLLILLLFRLGASVTVPGVNFGANFEDAFGANSVFGIFNLLGGGALRQFSLLSLGVSPYITASIITQLLSTDVVPVLTRLAKGGERGRKKLDLITRISAVIISLVQAVAISATLQQNQFITFPPNFNEAFSYIYIMVVLTGGSLFSLFLADSISAKGIGNGTSLVIFSGIIAVLPVNFVNLFGSIVSVGPQNSSFFVFQLFLYMLYVVFYFVLILAVVFVNQSLRQLPVQHTGSGLSLREEQISYLPLKVNSAGVIPVIFASSIITLPLTIAQFFPEASAGRVIVEIIFGLQSWGLILFGALIIIFTFFYAMIQINPDQISENFQKNGSFIPGVRPGDQTTQYIKSTLFRITIIGATFLTFIAVLPFFISIVARNIPSQLAFGGTGLIIVVGVAIDTTQQIDGRLTQKEYGRFRSRQEALLANKFTTDQSRDDKDKNEKIHGIW